MIPAKNDALNIPRRQYIIGEDKSITLSEGNLSKITDENVKMSLILQREFGLRREESIKIRIHQAMTGDELRLKGSWCKGKRPRNIKIRTSQQWQAIKQVKAFVGKSQRALIPHDKTYVQQETIYDNQLKRAGIHKAHGLRHAYAQQLYYDMTGWHCPAKGGPLTRELTDEQKIIDHLARQQISTDLGHNRLELIKIYCS